MAVPEEPILQDQYLGETEETKHPVHVFRHKRKLQYPHHLNSSHHKLFNLDKECQVCGLRLLSAQSENEIFIKILISAQRLTISLHFVVVAVSFAVCKLAEKNRESQ